MNADRLDGAHAVDVTTTATWREIHQQPAVWRAVATLVKRESDQIAAFLGPLLARSDLRIVLTGAGTSAFAGSVLAPALTRTLRRRVEAVATTDLVAGPREVFAEDLPTLLVSFARSGDSPESVAAARLADECLSDVSHLVLTCNADGQLAQDRRDAGRSMVVLMPPGTNDSGFAMTSSFSAMLLAGWLILGAPDLAVVEQLAGAGERLLADAGRLDELVQRRYGRVVYLGSGSLAALARESALKLIELTAGDVVTYWDSALGFRHGPKSVLDPTTLVVCYVSNDPYTRRYDEDIVAELRRSLSSDQVLVLSAGDASAPTDGRWQLSGLDDVPDIGLALPYVMVAQLFALQMSGALGRTPDNPFPDGEVNRVVQGVTIHSLPA